jgi:hypothetical protein
MAAAIAMAESGGNPGISHRNSDGSIDRGLWQINSTHGALSTFDRLGNAKAAVSISGNGRNWNPWTVFKTGVYKRFLGQAQGAQPAAGGGGSQPNAAPRVSGGSLGNPSLAGGRGSQAGYEGALAETGLGKAQAGDNPVKLLAAVNDELHVKRQRLNKIKKALKRRLRPATRTRLLQEAAELIGEIGDLGDLAGTLKGSIGSGAAHVDPSSGAPVDTSDTATGTDTSGGAAGGTSDDATAALAEATTRLAELIAEQVANQVKILALAQQGPEILAAVIAAVNGDLGGRVGLGFQTPGYAGGVASYGGSTGRP